MVFYNISGEQLDWDWEPSTDGGKNWKQLVHSLRKNRVSPCNILNLSYRLKFKGEELLNR